MVPAFLRGVLGLVLCAVLFAAEAGAQTVPGRVGTGGSNVGGIGGGLGGGGAGSPGAMGGSGLSLDRSLNSTLGGVGSAPVPDETIRAVVPAANSATGQGSPPAPGQPAPDTGGSNCICVDGRPADGNNQCVVYRQGVPASVPCQ